MAPKLYHTILGHVKAPPLKFFELTLQIFCLTTSPDRPILSPMTAIGLSDNQEKIMAEKAVNYTPEQTLKMVADYQAGVSTEEIAQGLGKTIRSVVAKLSREGVYQKKTYVTKTGEKPVKKDAHADAIGAILQLSEGEIDSLTKANKTALVKIFQALANSKPI